MIRTFALILACALPVVACDAEEADSAPAQDAAVLVDAESGAGGQGGEGGQGGVGGVGGAVDAGMDAGSRPDMASACAPAGVVDFMTDDGVRLVADFAPAGPRVTILLHMIPPSNTRSNYPGAFIDALNARGISVLNVDRRGAGDSDGDARDAYMGPNGWLDAKAARDFVLATGCAIDPARVTIVGASNGTTTALDYAIEAPADAQPAALVLLTGGGYTEGQYRIADQRARLDALPILFVFSTAERGWSAEFAGLMAAPSWQFIEYADGAHGTRMFGAVPESIAAVAEWIDTTTP
ncbi:MAG: pimeloyl-ACP methyl ester carboxylesterase [Bradymonadia bacterium]|jgi:pimeloyl-ACP methyl ester carboxylesterase